jgi:hypothetical protein
MTLDPWFNGRNSAGRTSSIVPDQSAREPKIPATLVSWEEHLQLFIFGRVMLLTVLLSESWFLRVPMKSAQKTRCLLHEAVFVFVFRVAKNMLPRKCSPIYIHSSSVSLKCPNSYRLRSKIRYAEWQPKQSERLIQPYNLHVSIDY